MPPKPDRATRKAKPLRRVRLQFRSHEVLERIDEAVRGDLSALALAERSLWTANDEFASVEQLTAQGDGKGYGEHHAFKLYEAFDLPGGDGEMDIEGIAVDGDWLWVVGSHSHTRRKPKGDDAAEALANLTEVKWEPNRAFLGRLPLVRGDEPDTFEPVVKDGDGRRAACLRTAKKRHKSALAEALWDDEHIGRFMSVPAKENGFDIEGVAARGERVLLGMRGPVLRGWATVLELEVKEKRKGRLKLRKIGPGGARYRKHFLDLDGLGIRDLEFDGDDLLLLAGPTMDISGPVRVYRWARALAAGEQVVVRRDELEVVLDLPHGDGADHAEGLAVVPGARELMVLYDSPEPGRLHDDGCAIDADVFALPKD